MIRVRRDCRWGLAVLLALTAGVAACAAVAPAPPTTVAVWDLEDLNPGQPRTVDLGALLAGQVMARLDGDGRFRAVERQNLLKVLEELHLGSSELADPQTRLRLGRISGARQMIFGSFQTIGPAARVDLRLVDVASGRILHTGAGSSGAADLNGWFQATDQAAAELLK